MRKAGAFLLILLLSFPLLYAQEQEEEPPPDGDWDYYAPDSYSHGDQTFIISLGTVFPTVFFNDGKYYKNHNFVGPFKGAAALSYNYYLTSHIFLGAEISGLFMPTLGDNVFFAIPLGMRTGYQFYLWRFEFPLNITFGMVWHNFLNNRYYGFYMKGGLAIYFRYSPEWSFGINANWNWLPEWTEDRSKNIDGNVVDLLLSARYHF
ncbi:MAG: hypothetical protein LBV17_05135 [Treponema sp.]|jgi:hypothetical protein|nr:hypothetical protein [Treponema sp.]